MPTQKQDAVGVARRLGQALACKSWKENAGWWKKCVHLFPNFKYGNLKIETWRPSFHLKYLM